MNGIEGALVIRSQPLLAEFAMLFMIAGVVEGREEEVGGGSMMPETREGRGRGETNGRRSCGEEEKTPPAPLLIVRWVDGVMGVVLDRAFWW